MKRIDFDNTMMSTFHVCRRKYDLRINRGVVPKVTATALDFGKAIHSGLDQWYKTKDVPASVKVFYTNYKEDITADDKRTNVLGKWIIENYAANYENQGWELVSSEIPFKVALPWGTNFIGRIDKIIKWDGALWVVDHKTTSGLGSSYFKMAEPNTQFMGYVYAARKLGYPVAGVIVDAILVAKGLLEAKSRAKLTPFARYDAHYSDDLMTEWETWMRATQAAISVAEDSGFYLPNYESCTYWGECPYRKLCIEEPRFRDKMIAQEYAVEYWDPLTGMEVKTA